MSTLSRLLFRRYVGADLAQLCMEAALAAIREQLPHVDMDSDRVEKGDFFSTVIVVYWYLQCHAGMLSCC